MFFYHDGVYNADVLRVPPQDEHDLLADWAELKNEHGVELNVCIAAALRRGVLNSEEAHRYERAAANLHPAFEIAGLGQLIDALVTADRSITFAA